MTDRHKNPSSHVRDQNLSSVLETITDDGPARAKADDQNQDDERGYASLIEKAYRQSNARVEREPAVSPARVPRDKPTRKRRSWRRELTIAGITGTAAIVALIALYAPWGTESSSRGSTDARPVDNSTTELKTIQKSSKLLSKRVDELSTENDRAVQQLDRKLSGEHETTRQRLSALEQRVAQVGRVEEQLAALSSRLDRLESDVRERTSRDSSMQSAEERAEVRRSDQRNTQNRAVTRTSARTAPPPQTSSGDQVSRQAAAVSKVDEAASEPPVGKAEEHAPESEQIPASETPTPEPDADKNKAAESAHDQSDDLSSGKAAPLIVSEPKSDEDEIADDNDASQSETVGTDEDGSGKKWAISLIALASKEKIQALERKYTAKGVKVEIVRIGRLFALRVPGFADRAAATAYSDTVKRKLGIRDVWIYEY